MAVSFIGGRNRSTRREPPTMGKQLVNFITCDCESKILGNEIKKKYLGARERKNLKPERPKPDKVTNG
jgi:hypothetical protein